MPNGGSTFTFNYSYGDPLTETFAHPARDNNGLLNLTLNYTNIVPRTVEVEWNVLIEDYETVVAYTREMVPAIWGGSTVRVDPTVIIQDDGSGGLAGYGTTFGSFVYSSGTLSILPDYTASIPKPIYSHQQIGTAIRPKSRWWN